MTKEKSKKYLLKENAMTRQNVKNCKTKAIKKEDAMTRQNVKNCKSKMSKKEEVMSEKIDTRFYPIKMNVYTEINANSQDPKISEEEIKNEIKKFSLSLKGAIEIAKILMDEGNSIGEISINDSYGLNTFDFTLGRCF